MQCNQIITGGAAAASPNLALPVGRSVLKMHRALAATLSTKASEPAVTHGTYTS